MLSQARAVALFLALAGLVSNLPAQVFTVQVGTPAGPPTPLVNHNDTWFLHKGTNAPQAGWHTIDDGTLNADWASAPGGFGYGDNAITNTPGTTYESTMLADMLNRYTTVFIRRTFNVASTVGTNLHLYLTMDYDDGFVAYLDGVEIRRANTSNAVGSTVTFAQTTGANTHEASCCNAPVNPPTVYDLGAVSNRLSVGTHVLAIVGLNQSLASSDFHLIADLSIEGASGTVANNGLYALTSDSAVTLTGTNTIAGASRVSVNGDDAAFNSGAGTWSSTITLAPGFNRLYIAALDGSGNMLSNLTQDVVYEAAPLTVSGPLGASTFWTNTLQVIHITSTVTVPTGVTLTIGPGVVVIVSPGASLLAGAGGIIDVQGTDAAKVHFLPAVSNVWNEVAADGAASFLTIRHADINRGAVKFRNGATGLMEDSFVHEYKNGSVPIAGCTSAAGVTVRRCHFSVYHETLWQDTLMTIENNVFENADNVSSDALDFDGAHVGSFIRRCTFRFGPQSNTDAIDIGPTTGGSGSTNTIIEGCLMHDFPNDKGVSIGEGCYGIVIRNCVIHHTESGVGVKNSPGGKPPCTAIIYNTTISDCDFGFRCYHKQDPNSPIDGGQITNSFNNILFNNRTNIGLYNGGIAVAEFSDIGGGWPGAGNFSADPLFVNPAIRDYRVQAGSPTIGAGMGGTNLGAPFPVGGIPMWVSNLVAISSGGGNVLLSWVETADNEDGFRIERSTNKLTWAAIGSATPNATSFADVTAPAGLKYYYRVRATNDVGVSPYSNIAGVQTEVVVAGGNVGGTITANTCWADNGVFTVTSSITVPAGVRLTIKPGATVQFNSGLKMTVNGRLLAEGTAGNHIRFTKATASNWNGLDFINTTVESRLAYIDFDSCAGSTVGGHNAQLHVNGGSIVFIDHCTWPPTPVVEFISFDASSFIVQFCTFPSYPPPTGPESLHGVNGIPVTGYGIFRDNYFGHTWGFNDTIDFTGGQRPGAILQIINNVFDGASDDHLDLDSTDAWIEGNIFMHAHRDPSRTDQAIDTASAISGGVDVIGQNSDWTIINNVFYDVDHVFLNKGNSTTTPNGGGRVAFLYNTVVHVAKEYSGTTAPEICIFNWSDDNVVAPAPGIGSGMYAAHNIFVDAPVLQRFYFPTSHTVIFENNIFPPSFKGTSNEWTGVGGGNQYTNPLLNLTVLAGTDPTNVTAAQLRSALQLLPNSPALGTGFGGRNIGGLNTNGIAIAGEPASPTLSSNATLTVGPVGTFTWGTNAAQRWGWTAFKWKLDNGPWSAEIVVSNPPPFTNLPSITLSNLANGPHTVYVSGRNDVGYYQDDPFVYPATAGIFAHVTASKTWVVGNGSLDTDGDGMPDAYENQYPLALNPNNPNDGALDYDGDGLTNFQEYLAGTNPQSAASVLRLFSLTGAGGSFHFDFQAVSNRTYTVQHRASLGTGAWLNLQSLAATSFNRTISITTAPGASRFYQVITP